MSITKVDSAVMAIKRLISSGELAKNGRLPSERELCVLLDVSRNTLRTSLGQLEANGDVWRRAGSGTYAGRMPLEKRTGLVELGASTSPMELMDLRLIMEPSIARLAARNATKAEIDNMYYIVRKGDMAVDSISYEKWDTALHNSIAAATHNNLIKETFHSINAIRDFTLWGELRDKILANGAQKKWSLQHQGFVDAISRRDGRTAEELARAHVLEVRGSLE